MLKYAKHPETNIYQDLLNLNKVHPPYPPCTKVHPPLIPPVLGTASCRAARTQKLYENGLECLGFLLVVCDNVVETTNV